ncbi:unnamed protein product [Strongylus vulgaris]|uniref:Uncharacterized protein n=1 Tax=Strongylus vulgaris TaxID=40348 RepID=A0A3P7IV09_STRVU|nr:unnamed protein product [Strongylus vulgaris]
MYATEQRLDNGSIVGWKKGWKTESEPRILCAENEVSLMSLVSSTLSLNPKIVVEGRAAPPCRMLSADAGFTQVLNPSGLK